MNFNIDFNLEQVMDKIGHDKTLRNWTYIVLLFACLFAFLWKCGDIATGLAELVRAIQGR